MTEAATLTAEIADEAGLPSWPHQQLESPDFYGPFLRGEEIARPNPVQNGHPLLPLEVGNFILKPPGGEAFKPGRHGRFILNALLHEPEGRMYTNQLYEAGFFPNSANYKSRQVTLTTTMKKLEESLNAGSPSPVIGREGHSQARIIRLSPEVQVIRLHEPMPRERIVVRPTSESVLVPKADRAQSSLHLRKLPETYHNFIEIREFADAAYGDTLAYVRGTSEAEPTFETLQDLRRGRIALSALAGYLNKDEEERFKIINDLIREFEASETAVSPLPGPSVGNGVREYPKGQEWKADANCAGVDPELFYPEQGADTRDAKAVCKGCDVQSECLEYALAKSEKFGVWGGKSVRERRKIKKERGRQRTAVTI